MLVTATATAALTALAYVLAMLSHRRNRHVAWFGAAVLLLAQAVLFLGVALLGGHLPQGLTAAALLGWGGAVVAAVLAARRGRTSAR